MKNHPLNTKIAKSVKMTQTDFSFLHYNWQNYYGFRYIASIVIIYAIDQTFVIKFKNFRESQFRTLCSVRKLLHQNSIELKKITTENLSFQNKNYQE